MEKVRLKREKNKQRLNELGIGGKFAVVERRRRLPGKRRLIRQTERDGSPTSVVATPGLSPPDSTTPSATKTANVVTPVRRSARQMRKPVQYTAIDAIEDADRRLERKIAERKRGRTAGPEAAIVKRMRVKGIAAVTPIGRATIEKLTSVPSDDWVEDMQRYYAEHVGNSVNNVQRVMVVVRKLAGGIGVQHPATRESFKNNEKIHIGCNFRAMLDDASEWVYSNGGDRGNGWLIEHPVKKCLIYQIARVERGTAFFSSAKP